MKKLFAVLIGLLIVLMFTLITMSFCYADVNNKIVDRTITLSAEVEDTGINSTGFKRMAFFVDYAELGNSDAIEATISFEASRDNVNYVDIPFFDVAGGATPQTSERITSDSTSLMWLDRDLNFPFLKVEINPTIESGQIDIEIYRTGQK